jgi:preprotein translocase subunit SecY
LALFQSLGIAVALESSAGLVIESGFRFPHDCGGHLTAGTMFLMWLGEQITERGLGNGISILIFGGIAAGCRVRNWRFAGTGSHGCNEHHCGGLLVVVIVVGLVTYFVVFVERGQRKDLGQLCPSAGW